MSLLALLLVQAVVRIAPPVPVLPPGDPAAAFALFRQVCVEPFPAPARFEAAIAARPGFARWRPASSLEALVPGETWRSPTATVRYIADDPYGADLPRPQCHVTVVAPTGADAELLFPRLAAVLGLGQGRVVGKTRYRTAMWDLDRAGGTRWRVILGTERHGDRMALKLSMLNLGAKR